MSSVCHAPVGIKYPIEYGMYLVFEESTATGEESKILLDSISKYIRHYVNPTSRYWTLPVIKFNSLRHEWEEESVFLSSITEICTHPAYQQIIGMGQTALPFIVNAMIEKPNHWFWALKAITGEDPVPASKKGKISEMINSWFLWWQINKYKYEK